MIQQTFQQYASLREEECVMKFFNTLAGFANIDQETYRCELIVITCPLYSLSDLNCRPSGNGAMRLTWGAREGWCLLIGSRATGPHAIPLNAADLRLLAWGQELESQL